MEVTRCLEKVGPHPDLPFMAVGRTPRILMPRRRSAATLHWKELKHPRIRFAFEASWDRPARMVLRDKICETSAFRHDRGEENLL